MSQQCALASWAACPALWAAGQGRDPAPLLLWDPTCSAVPSLGTPAQEGQDLLEQLQQFHQHAQGWSTLPWRQAETAGVLQLEKRKFWGDITATI